MPAGVKSRSAYLINIRYVMPQIFEKVATSRPPMSAFDLSREQKLSGRIGNLIPTYLEEIVPGDQFRVNTESLVRFLPMIAPVMHRVDCYMHYFFVPNRLIWDQWEDFITGGQEGTTTPAMPVLSFTGGASIGSLHDYLGLPTPGADTASVNVSALPFRAYQLIHHEYYRDETIDPELIKNPSSFNSLATSELVKIRNVRQEKDYFSSALPWPQRGADQSAPIEFSYKDISDIFNEDGSSPGISQNVETDSITGDQISAAGLARIENIESISMLINDLRRSSAIQRFLEKQARGGYRYIETIFNHFGVRSSDARLQRPEYLGGGRQPVSISEVLNTSATASEPQGNMSGHGVATGATQSFTAEFEEHGYVIGMFFVRPKPGYQQGVMRHWTRFDKFDFYWPEFANLGEQEIINRELFFDSSDDAYNAETFGYQQRYAEMKYGCDTVHGLFRTDLNHWTMARIFATQPNLNPDFVNVESEDYDRVFAVAEEHDILVQLYHHVAARRPMPYFADPSLT